MNIDFINIENGLTFDGRAPYITWYQEPQSIGLKYIYTILFVTDQVQVQVNMPDNQLFKLLNIDGSTQPDVLYKNSVQIHDLDYVDLDAFIVSNRVSVGVHYSDNLYVHVLYVCGESEQPGEYVQSIYIDDQEILIGGQFYDLREELGINLANLGSEIPTQFTKALGTTNVREDKPDPTTINRKRKELLNFQWDIMANKGSYNSLINSLLWFEWGPDLKLYENWHYKDEMGKRIFENRELKSLLMNRYSEALSRFSKTTYISIGKALKSDIVHEYDSEHNPKLEYVIEKWCMNDVMLKLSVLGSFYESFFMPIHLDLLHCTIEDIVYTNTMKLQSSVCPCQYSQICCFDDLDIEIKPEHIITNINTQLNNKTLFGTPTYEPEHILIVGTEPLIDTIENNEDLKLFWSQKYAGTGTLIPVRVKVPKLAENERIISEKLILRTSNKYIIRNEHRIFDGKALNFNILLREPEQYNIYIEFRTNSNRILSDSKLFNVVDNRGIYLEVYKVKYNAKGTGGPDYISMLAPNQDGVCMQYIPSECQNLNHTLIFKEQPYDQLPYWLRSGYKLYRKTVLRAGTKDEYNHFLIAIAKQPGKYNPDVVNPDQIPNLYRNDYGYYSDLHELEPIEKSDNKQLSDYIVSNKETICVLAKIGNQPFRYSYEKSKWKFINRSTEQEFELPCLSQPILAEQKDQLLPPGFYDIILEACTAPGKTQIIRLDSGFRIV